MNQRGFANNIILVIAVVVLIGIGGYFAIVKKFQPTIQTLAPTLSQPSAIQPAPTPQSKTAGWKTYRNVQYGLEIIYPPNWTVSIEKTNVFDHGTGKYVEEINFKSPAPTNSIISFFPGGLGTSSNEGELCPATVREIECKELINSHGIRYARTLSVTQLTGQVQLDAWIPGFQVTAVTTDPDGKELPETKELIKVFDTMLGTLRLL